MLDAGGGGTAAVLAILGAVIHLAAQAANAPPASAPATGASAREISVTQRVFARDSKANQPIAETKVVLKLSDASPPERPLRELDPYGMSYRIEYPLESQQSGRESLVLCRCTRRPAVSG